MSKVLLKEKKIALCLNWEDKNKEKKGKQKILCLFYFNKF